MRDLSKDLNESITLRMGPGRLSLLLVGALVLAFLSYTTWSERPADTLPHLIAGIGMVLFGFGVVLAPILMLWPMASIRMSPQGLEYRVLVMKLGPIPWGAIRAVSVRARGGSSQIVQLDIPDRHRYRSSAPAADPLGDSPFFQALRRRPLRIIASAVGVTGEELAAAIQARMNKFGNHATSSQQGSS